VSKQQVKNDLIKLLTDDINNPTDDKENDMLSVDLLIAYPNHPFKLYEGDRLADMVRSIKEMGILLPIIVRPAGSDNEQYEILSGHNRVNAAKEAGLTEIPAIIKHDLSDNEANLIVTEKNLMQRSFADLK
jgi:ParB family chromosome partitioning protein